MRQHGRRQSQTASGQANGTFHCPAQALKLCLLDCPYPEVRHLDCDLVEGVATLRGRVTSYYMKQLAQAIAARAEGVVAVHNAVEVAPPTAP